MTILPRGFAFLVYVNALVPLLINIYLCSRVIHASWAQIRKIRAQEDIFARHRDKKRKRDISSARTLTLVFALFFMCWLPYLVSAPINLKYRNNATMRRFRDTSVSVGMVNSCLNSLIYGWRNKAFRTAFARICGCKSVLGRNGSCENLDQTDGSISVKAASVATNGSLPR